MQTIKEIADAYRESVQLLKDRRSELRAAIKFSTDQEEVEQLQNRHKELYSIERDAVKICKHLEEYCRTVERMGINES